MHPSVPLTSSRTSLFLSFVRIAHVPFSVRWAVLKWVTINSQDIRAKRSQSSVCESHLCDKQQTLQHNSLANTTAASSISSYVCDTIACVSQCERRYEDIDSVYSEALRPV
ncbi:hypothetical protein QQF64_012706 [Cirrhinus molitorella]|uniref:Uncharacterized protein n=1 Tax=Cirrhinus molitorella TaxID=172907 RepID=A0ABR3LYQ8_9TELE